MRTKCSAYLVFFMLAGLTPARAADHSAGTVALPARDVEVYRRQIAGVVARMETLRAVVARIDAAENIGSDTLASAAKEFTDLRRTLEKVQPSAVLAVTHDLLMTSCRLSAMASRLGIDAA